MITAYSVIASFRGNDFPPSSTYYLNMKTAERHADSANAHESSRHGDDPNERNFYRVEPQQIEEMWIEVELPYTTSNGTTKFRKVGRMARKLRKMDGIITGVVRDHYVTKLVQRAPDSVIWRYAGDVPK